jgi:hypothetical protein
MDNNTNQSNKQPSSQPKGAGNSPNNRSIRIGLTIIFLALMGLYFFGGDTTKKENIVVRFSTLRKRKPHRKRGGFQQ